MEKSSSLTTPISPSMNTISSKGLSYPSAIVAIFTLLALMAAPAQAANATWSATPTNANWESTGSENNWNTGAVFPGSTSTTNNTDTALFLNSSGTSILINSTAGNSSPLNIKSITFGQTATAINAFTIGTTGGNELLLTTGGTISFAADTIPTNTTETINAPIVIGTGTAAQTYSFTNSNLTSSNILVFGGAISGGTTGTTTLTLGGANTGANAINGVISNGAGTLALAESTGNWTLGNANTYTGGTTISGGGTLSISADNNLGAAPGSATAGNIVINGGTLATTATFTLNSNRGIALGPTTLSGGGTISVASGTTLTYNGTVANNNSAGNDTLTVTGGGTLVLSGVNTYNGLTTINGGSTLSTGATGYIGLNQTAGMIGIVGYQPANLILNGGTFQDVNTNSQEMYTQHGFTITTAGGTVDASGAAPIFFYSNPGFGVSGSGTHALTLTGTNTSGNTLAAAIVDGTGANAGSTSLTKSGVGTWVLTGGSTSTYTGGTTITGGTLIVEAGSTATGNGSLGAGNVSVAAGTGLDYDLTSASNAALIIGGTLNIAGGTGTVLGGSIGTSATGDEINVIGAATGSGALTVNIYGTSAAVASGTNTYTLLTGGAGTSFSFTPTLGIVYNNTNFTVGGVSSTSTAVQASITRQTAITSAFWVGGLTLPGTSNVWAASNGSTASNWSTTSGGSVQALIPGVGANVTIASAPTATMVLGANMSIKTLTISDTNGLNLAADGNTLTIDPTVAGTGITINSSVTAANTIGANVNVAAVQVWTNDAASLFTVSGTVSGAGTLTIAGTGNTTLSGVINTTHGAVTMSGSGILTLSGTNANLNDGLTSVNSGELDLAKTGVTAIFGNLTVGTGSGPGALVKLDGSNQIAMDGYTGGGGNGLTINSDGQFALNGFNATVIKFVSNGGTVTSSTPGGVLTVAGTAPVVTFGGTNATSTIGAGATVASTVQATVAGTDTLAVNGTLSDTGGLLLGDGSANVATLSGTGIVTGLVTAHGASGASVITPGTTSSIGKLTLNGGVTSTTGLTLNFAIDGAGATNSQLTLGSAGLSVTGGLTFNLYDQGTNTLASNTVYTIITGTGALSADTLTVNLLDSDYILNTSYGTDGILFSGDTATFEVESVAIPEPGTWALMFGGLALLMVIQRRKRQQD